MPVQVPSRAPPTRVSHWVKGGFFSSFSLLFSFVLLLQVKPEAARVSLQPAGEGVSKLGEENAGERGSWAAAMTSKYKRLLFDSRFLEDSLTAYLWAVRGYGSGYRRRSQDFGKRSRGASFFLN